MRGLLVIIYPGAHSELILTDRLLCRFIYLWTAWAKSHIMSTTRLCWLLLFT